MLLFLILLSPMPETEKNFEKLFKLNHRELMDLAYNIVRDADSARDVVQEVFLKLWQNKDKVEFGEQIRHYLFKATAHTALNHIRQQKKLTLLDEDHIRSFQAYPSRDDISFKELELKVRNAIDQLPPKCRAIYILSRHEGMKYQEIADTLEISVKTVENQMGIALEKLREQLKPFLTPEFLAIVSTLLFFLYHLFAKN